MTFTVPGLPAPKGSTRAFWSKKRGRPIITAANSKTRPWEQAIRHEARIAGCTAQDGPVEVDAIFYLPRPKGHYRTSGGLRASAPLFPVVKPDGDKLLRALLDGLTGEVYRDDAQVINASAAKRYADPPHTVGAEVRIYYPFVTRRPARDIPLADQGLVIASTQSDPDAFLPGPSKEKA